MAGKAKLHIQKIVDYLERGFKRSIAEAVEKTLEGVKVTDDDKLFRNFRERVKHNFNSVEEVPEDFARVWKDL